MGHFWAKFEKINGDSFRFDTRIYLSDIDAPKKTDACIGAIVGKNPGSAKASSLNSKLQAINLDGDKLLPTARNIVLKAYKEAKIPIPERRFIQVLNLFYLCNPNLVQGIVSLEKNLGAKICGSEKMEFHWVWYVWGGKSDNLNHFKNRFASINTYNHFYFDKECGCIVESPASESAFAKHTQGLKHSYVVPYIAKLIKNGY